MSDEESCDKTVVHISSEEYRRTDYHADLLEQYRVVCDRQSDIANDRNTQNKFLLTIMAALLAVPVVFLRLGPAEITFPQAVFVITFPAISAIISVGWIGWNKTFGEALGAGYRILKEIEVHLPAKPFTVENEYRNEAAEDGKEVTKGGHKTTTSYTILLPRLFLVGHIVLILTLLAEICMRSAG